MIAAVADDADDHNDDRPARPLALGFHMPAEAIGALEDEDPDYEPEAVDPAQVPAAAKPNERYGSKGLPRSQFLKQQESKGQAEFARVLRTLDGSENPADLCILTSRLRNADAAPPPL